MSLKSVVWGKNFSCHCWYLSAGESSNYVPESGKWRTGGSLPAQPGKQCCCKASRVAQAVSSLQFNCGFGQRMSPGAAMALPRWAPAAPWPHGPVSSVMQQEKHCRKRAKGKSSVSAGIWVWMHTFHSVCSVIKDTMQVTVSSQSKATLQVEMHTGQPNRGAEVSERVLNELSA